MDYRDLENDRQCNGAPQPPVDKQMVERARGFGARVEAVEQLTEDQHGERRGAGALQLLGPFNQSAGQVYRPLLTAIPTNRGGGRRF